MQAVSKGSKISRDILSFCKFEIHPYAYICGDISVFLLNWMQAVCIRCMFNAYCAMLCHVMPCHAMLC